MDGDAEGAGCFADDGCEQDFKKLRKHLYQIRKSNLGNNFNWWETAAFLFAWELELDDGWLDESEEGHQADQMTT